MKDKIHKEVDWYAVHFMSTESAVDLPIKTGEFHYFQIGMEYCLCCGDKCWLLNQKKSESESSSNRSESE